MGKNRKEVMDDFSHSYKISATTLSIMLALSCLGSLGSEVSLIGTVAIAILVGAVPFVPFRLRGGLDRNWRMAIIISVLFAIGFTGLLGFIFFEFVRTKGLEGPNGEGAPGAVIFAMVFFAITVQCPWLLTALRGMRCWKSHMKSSNLLQSNQPIPNEVIHSAPLIDLYDFPAGGRTGGAAGFREQHEK